MQVKAKQRQQKDEEDVGRQQYETTSAWSSLRLVPAAKAGENLLFVLALLFLKAAALP